MLFIVSEVELRPAPADVEAHGEAAPRITIERAGGVKCERCWRYVADGLERAGVGRPVRPVPGRARRDRPMDNALEELVGDAGRGGSRAPRRLLEFWLPIVIVALDQVTKALVRATVPLHDSVTVMPGLHGLHARAEHRRGVRHS